VRKLRRTPESQAFGEILGCLRKAQKEAIRVNEEIEESKKETCATIDDLLEIIDKIPVATLDDD
jgi:hypothetical protein